MSQPETKRVFEQLSGPLKIIMLIGLCLAVTQILFYQIYSSVVGIISYISLHAAIAIGLPSYFYINRFNINFLADSRECDVPSSGVGAIIMAYILAIGWPIAFSALLMVKNR